MREGALGRFTRGLWRSPNSAEAALSLRELLGRMSLRSTREADLRKKEEVGWERL